MVANGLTTNRSASKGGNVGIRGQNKEGISEGETTAEPGGLQTDADVLCGRSRCAARELILGHAVPRRHGDTSGTLVLDLARAPQEKRSEESLMLVFSEM